MVVVAVLVDWNDEEVEIEVFENWKEAKKKIKEGLGVKVTEDDEAVELDEGETLFIEEIGLEYATVQNLLKELEKNLQKSKMGYYPEVIVKVANNVEKFRTRREIVEGTLEWCIEKIKKLCGGER